jgi:myo-inositol-1(or 4)-monophosphatase
MTRPAATPLPLVDELAALAADLARTAGTMVRRGRAHGLSEVSTKSTATDMVTEYDRRAEQMIVDGIRARRPDDAVLGEEGSRRSGSSGIHWLIDPIDGTTNYLYGLAGYAVSIAAADEQGTLVAAVHLPATDELFTARRGGGAELDGRPLRPSTTETLASALVGTGFSYRPEQRERQARRLAELIGQVRDVRRYGAAAADLCYVAAGRLDVYFEEHLQPWDLAAGELIAREAGCRCGDFRGGPAHPDEVLVAAPQLFDAMAELLAEATRAVGSTAP